MVLQHCWQLKEAALPLSHPVSSQSMPETPLMLKVQGVGFSAKKQNSLPLSKNTKGPPEQCMVCQGSLWRRTYSLNIVIENNNNIRKSTNLSWLGLFWDGPTQVEECSSVWWVHISYYIWESWTLCPSAWGGRGPSRLLSEQNSWYHLW